MSKLFSVFSFILLFLCSQPFAYGQGALPTLNINGVKHRLLLGIRQASGEYQYFRTQTGYCVSQGKSEAGEWYLDIAANTQSNGPYVVIDNKGKVVDTYPDTEDNAKKFLIIIGIGCF